MHIQILDELVGLEAGPEPVREQQGYDFRVARFARLHGEIDIDTEEWMKQMARNLTMAGDSFLNGCRYLLHDRDTKFSAAYCGILRSAGVQPLALPPRSPNLNSHLERWNRSVKEECLSKLILFGEASIRHVLSHYTQHYHEERNHQGKDNMIPIPAAADRIGNSSSPIRTRERLGGLLKLYHREVA